MSNRIRTNKTVTHVTATTPAPSEEQAPTALSPTTGIALVFLQPPPADARDPNPSVGYRGAPTGGNYRSLVPKATELAALPGAVDDLRRFTAFASVFALTGLPYAQVLQAFDVGNQWSTMRKVTVAWEGYCLTQEGISSITIRKMLDSIRPVWDLAVARDSSLAVTYPSLASLLGAQKAIAQKGAATKRLNKAAVAKGEAPIHGAVGKKRKRASDKAVVAASTSPSTPPPAPATAAPAPAPAATGGASA